MKKKKLEWENVNKCAAAREANLHWVCKFELVVENVLRKGFEERHSWHTFSSAYRNKQPKMKQMNLHLPFEFMSQIFGQFKSKSNAVRKRFEGRHSRHT